MLSFFLTVSTTASSDPEEIDSLEHLTVKLMKHPLTNLPDDLGGLPFIDSKLFLSRGVDVWDLYMFENSPWTSPSSGQTWVK